MLIVSNYNMQALLMNNRGIKNLYWVVLRGEASRPRRHYTRLTVAELHALLREKGISRVLKTRHDDPGADGKRNTSQLTGPEVLQIWKKFDGLQRRLC
jgi:hypothetical protein